MAETSTGATLRGGLMGCGFFARNHLNAWREVRGAEIVAVCDLDVDRARQYAAEFGIAAVYDDPETMLRQARLDFADIVTQPATHRPLVELCAGCGTSVICQKPLAPTLEDARAMVEACHAAGVRFMVHENFRWQTPMRRLRALAEEVGPLFFGRMYWRTAYDVYANQPYLAEDPRFILMDMGVHLLDLARFFMGEAESVYCRTQRVNPRIRGEDVATLMLQMQDGATCLVELSYASRMPEELFPQTLVTLEGARGSVLLGPDFEVARTDERGVRRESARPRLLPWSDPFVAAIQESVVRIQQHWVDVWHAGLAPETSGADNLRTLELVFGAYAYAASGQAVRAEG